jgi:hypothetical protein
MQRAGAREGNVRRLAAIAPSVDIRLQIMTDRSNEYVCGVTPSGDLAMHDFMHRIGSNNKVKPDSQNDLLFPTP